MSGKSKRRLKKRQPPPPPPTAHEQIMAMKPWMVVTPVPITMVYAIALVYGQFGKQANPSDIEISVRPDLCTDGMGYVVDVDKARETAGLQEDANGITSDPFMHITDGQSSASRFGKRLYDFRVR